MIGANISNKTRKNRVVLYRGKMNNYNLPLKKKLTKPIKLNTEVYS